MAELHEYITHRRTKAVKLSPVEVKLALAEYAAKQIGETAMAEVHKTWDVEFFVSTPFGTAETMLSAEVTFITDFTKAPQSGDAGNV